MQIQCGQCRQVLEVPEGSEGQRTFCPRCGTTLEIPGPATPAETSHADSFPSENAFSETVVVKSDSSTSSSPPPPLTSSSLHPADASSANPYAAPSAFEGARRYQTPPPNPLAVVAFCLGLGSVGALVCCCVTPIPAFLGVPAVIVGAVGMIASRKPSSTGGGFALAGIVLGALATFLSAALFLFTMLS